MDLELGAEEVGVPIVVAWDECVNMTGVFSIFLRYGKVGHKFVAWYCSPHREHGWLTYIVGIL